MVQEHFLRHHTCLILYKVERVYHIADTDLAMDSDAHETADGTL